MKLPAQYEDDCGRLDYTAAGQAEADMTSAIMALDRVLRREDLTAAQRRDFTAARRAAVRSQQITLRHVDPDAVHRPETS